MKPIQVRVRGLLGALLVLASATLFAQELPSEDVDLSGVETGWHTVRPGENLIRITSKYLGSTARWRDNWKLNPDVSNPHVIQPGTRIRVILRFETAPPVARLKTLSGRVQSRPAPIPWNDARVQDLLVEKDGLRTYRNSSTEIEFQDGTGLFLTEESLVFVRPSSRSVSGPTKRSVEIVEGQAELQSVSRTGRRTDIEIVVGSATATARQTEDGRAQTRARKSEDGSAKVMVYAGSSEVEAAGQSVEVPEGMGTAVPEDAPPAPPEELLPAPEPSSPASGTELRFGNPWFTWQPVATASSHTLELCRDTKCGELLRRELDLGGGRWQPERLPEGTIYWRVTAVSESGLDGYPSEPQRLEVLAGDPDGIPPTGTARVSGESITAGDVEYFAPSARVEVSMEDAESGLESWKATVNGREVDTDELGGPWSHGEHEVRAFGVDYSGNRGETPTLRFKVDAEGPEIEIKTGDADLLSAKLGQSAVPEWWECRKRRWARRHAVKQDARAAWTVLASGSDTTPLTETLPTDDRLTRKDRPVSSHGVTGANPGVLLFLAGRLGGDQVATEDHYDIPVSPACSMEQGAVVWIEASDAATDSVTRLDLESPADGTSLRLESEDALGNVTTISIELLAPEL